mmetsp:Transcript_2746/g.6129  ORF Transcript_2746/g.6129 Transcript_2746/m.6129 type:complete len:95 (+) Transcript_2746:132-416(+)
MMLCIFVVCSGEPIEQSIFWMLWVLSVIEIEDRIEIAVDINPVLVGRDGNLIDMDDQWRLMFRGDEDTSSTEERIRNQGLALCRRALLQLVPTV